MLTLHIQAVSLTRRISQYTNTANGKLFTPLTVQPELLAVGALLTMTAIGSWLYTPPVSPVLKGQKEVTVPFLPGSPAGIMIVFSTFVMLRVWIGLGGPSSNELFLI